MSIRALHYITGDTQQAGFRCIGGSDAFPADSLPAVFSDSVLFIILRQISGSILSL